MYVRIKKELKNAQLHLLYHHWLTEITLSEISQVIKKRHLIHGFEKRKLTNIFILVFLFFSPNFFTRFYGFFIFFVCLYAYTLFSYYFLSYYTLLLTNN